MITQKSIKILERYWKSGFIGRYDLPRESRDELKRLGLLTYCESSRIYYINREVYVKMMKETQSALFSDNAQEEKKDV